MGAREQRWTVLFNFILSLRQGIFLNPNFAHLSRLAGQQALGFRPVPYC